MYAFLSLATRDVMTRSVVYVSPGQSLAELEQIFATHEFNGCPVVDAGELVGFVTKLDFLKAFLFNPRSVVPPYETIMKKTIGAVMTPTVVTVPEDRPLTRVLQMMVDLRTKAFPVVDAGGKLVGMVAREDIARALCQSIGK
ncbi:MAG: CBS domain-containing protein [Deltaproteobacteria bacterium]|nr:CBS domain-containing protein [Deltaproteobacteria bacterium]